MTDNVPNVQEAVPQTEVETVSTENETVQDANQADDASTAKEQKPINGYEKRIARQTKALSEANRRIQELTAEVAKFRQPEKDADPAPNEADFDSVEAYSKAVGKWEARQEQKAEEAKKATAEQQRKFQELAAEKQRLMETRAAEFKKSHPEFDERYEVFNEALSFVNQNTNSFKAFADAVFSSDMPEVIVYEVGSDPDKLEELLSKNPTQIYREITRIEARYEEKPTQPEQEVKEEKPKKIAQPPAPLKGNGKVQKELSSDMPWSEMKKELRKLGANI